MAADNTDKCWIMLDLQYAGTVVYTVSGMMSVTVEKAKGRIAPIDCMTGSAKLLLLYNGTAKEPQPKSSQELLMSNLKAFSGNAVGPC